eukprot:3377658-Ditylum_brightwellii.AAC.1
MQGSCGPNGIGQGNRGEDCGVCRRDKLAGVESNGVAFLDDDAANNGAFDGKEGGFLFGAPYKLNFGAGEAGHGLNGVRSAIPELLIVIYKSEKSAELFQARSMVFKRTFRVEDDVVDETEDVFKKLEDNIHPGLEDVT